MKVIDTERVDVPQIIGRVYVPEYGENNEVEYDNVVESVMGYMAGHSDKTQMVIIDPIQIDFSKYPEDLLMFISLYNAGKITQIENVKQRTDFVIKIPIAEKPSSYPQTTRNRYNARKCKTCSYCYKTALGASRCINILYADLAFIGVKSNPDACVISMSRRETSYVPACAVQKHNTSYHKASVQELLKLMDYLKDYKQFYVSSSRYRGGYRRRGYTPLAIDLAIEKLNTALKGAVTSSNLLGVNHYKPLMNLMKRPGIIVPSVDDLWFKLKETKSDTYHQIKNAPTYMDSKFKAQFNCLPKPKQLELGRLSATNLMAVDAYNFMEVLV